MTNDHDINPVRPDEGIRQNLRRLRLRLRAWLVTHGLGRLLGSLTVFAAASLLMDRSFRLDLPQRSIILLGGVVVLTVILVRRIAIPSMTRMSDTSLCWHLRKIDEPMAEKMLAALELSAARPGPVDPGSLAASAMADTGDSLDPTLFRHVLNRDRLNRARIILGACLAAWTVFVMVFPVTAVTWARRNVLLQQVKWPQRTRLLLQNAETGLAVVEGDDLVISVLAQGRIPRRVELAIDTQGRRASETLPRYGTNLFQTTLTRVSTDMRIRCRGGDDDTGWVPVRLVARPRLVSLAVAYEAPAYTRWGTRSMRRDESVFAVPAGGWLSVSGRVSKALQAVACQLGDASPAEPAQTHGNRFAVPRRQLMARTNTLLTLTCTDCDGLLVAPPPRVPLRVTADQPPRVVLDVAGSARGSLRAPSFPCASASVTSLV